MADLRKEAVGFGCDLQVAVEVALHLFAVPVDRFQMAVGNDEEASGDRGRLRLVPTLVFHSDSVFSANRDTIGSVGTHSMFSREYSSRRPRGILDRASSFPDDRPDVYRSTPLNLGALNGQLPLVHGSTFLIGRIGT